MQLLNTAHQPVEWRATQAVTLLVTVVTHNTWATVALDFGHC